MTSSGMTKRLRAWASGSRTSISTQSACPMLMGDCASLLPGELPAIDDAAFMQNQGAAHLGGELVILGGNERGKAFRAHELDETVQPAGGRACIEIARGFVGDEKLG